MPDTAKSWPIGKAPLRGTPRGCTADFRAWTAAEDDAVRAGYVRGKAAKLVRSLGRSVTSVRKRARRLGLLVQRRWSAEDIQTLRSEWGHKSLGKLALELKHPRLSVYQQANVLGLLAVPDGYETLTDAADRSGYSTDQLWMILEWAGVEVKARTTRTTRRKKPGHRFHHVDPFDVDEAIAAWCKTEPLECAAERHGVSGAVLRNWLRWARNAGFDVPPEPTKKKAHYRVPSELADRVVAWRMSLEPVTRAAARLGMRRQALTAKLLEAGVPRVSVKPWLVSRADLERAIGKVAA